MARRARPPGHHQVVPDPQDPQILHRPNRRTSLSDSKHRPISPLPRTKSAGLWMSQLTHPPSSSRHGTAMRQHGAVTSAFQPIFSPLVTSALETERHVAAAGWDQPPRLFALVRTSGLLEREPHLRDEVGKIDEDGLTAIEQDGLPDTSSLESLLAQIAWPDDVDGVALAVERLVVPPEAESNLPEDPDQAAEVLGAHPDRKDVRLLVAVLRDGESTCLLRQRDHDADDKVASGSDIAPGLVAALSATLQD